MGKRLSAKEILIKPISKRDGNKLVIAYHYSKRFDPRSQLHFGVFLRGNLLGVMQFGPSIDKRRTRHLVRGTHWNGFVELNRMAFSPLLPRNSESRALSIAKRIFLKHYPHIEWIVSFADATQSGDGAIYRAAGFVLTGIKENKSIYRMPDGRTFCAQVLTIHSSGVRRKELGFRAGTDTLSSFKSRVGAVCLNGFQLRYILFLRNEARKRLAVPALPYSMIDDMKAGMYLGKKMTRRKH